MTRVSFTAYTIVLYLLLSAGLLLAALRATEGVLNYTLDDPYIHLAVAETILRGGYGINFPETSSPSSSILYPFILTALLWGGAGGWAPLLAGLGATTVMLCYAGPVLFRFAVAGTSVSTLMFFSLPPLFLFAVNAVALPLTGMEHPLHVLAVILTISGFVTLAYTGRVPARLAVGVVLGPLIRFEGFALSLAAIFMLFMAGHRRASAGLAGVLGAIVLAYGAFMWLQNLPLVPSSVLVKSSATAAAFDRTVLSSLRAVLGTIWGSQWNRWGMLFALGIALLLPFCFDRTAKTFPLAICAVALLGGHLALGQYGWFSRYEVYAVAGLILALVVIYGEGLLRFSGLQRFALISVALFVIAVPYMETTSQSPVASRNIYEQQYQMHRFATDFFPQAVAVNDLGWVAYQNDQYVLDLWGLGSEEARQASREGQRDAAFLRDITGRKNVVYAMIYDAWFEGAVPDDWCRIAQLNTIMIAAASGEVGFYLIDLEQEAAMRAALHAFDDTLPDSVTLDVYNCEGG